MGCRDNAVNAILCSPFHIGSAPPPSLLRKIYRGIPSHARESPAKGACDIMKQRLTRYLSIRVIPEFEEFLKVVADEFGLSKSRYARWVLVQELKRQRARYHVLGWDRPRKPQTQVVEQCSAPTS